MENDNSNFEKNKYNTQISGEQFSDLEKEKSNNKLADKVENGLNIHSMPNSFRAGKFNSSVHPNDIDKESNAKNKSIKPQKHKYIGILIIAIGILVLGGLGYFLYGYIMEGSQNNNNQVVQEDNFTEDNQADKQENVEEDVNQEDKKTPININDENKDEEIGFENDINENINDTENGTSTNETATSTNSIDQDNATSTEETVIIKDTDDDGLTDPEEHLLNSNLNLKDSDSDGYDDVSEVFSLYNPAGTNALLDNPGINEYSNPLHNYTILYPQAWTRKINNGGDSVMFMNNNEGFFQISVEDNNEALNIEDWYRQEFNLKEGEDLNYFSEKGEMISSDDGLFVYYTDQEKIYVFSYIAMSQKPLYPNIFKAFVISFNLN